MERLKKAQNSPSEGATGKPLSSPADAGKRSLHTTAIKLQGGELPHSSAERGKRKNAPEWTKERLNVWMPEPLMEWVREEAHRKYSNVTQIVIDAVAEMKTRSEGKMQ